MKPPRVEVEWRDACLQSSCVPVSKVRDHAELSTRRTVGYLVIDDRATGTPDGLVVVAVTYDEATAPNEEDHVDDLFVIPAGWVTAITHLDRKPRKKKETAGE